VAWIRSLVVLMIVVALELVAAPRAAAGAVVRLVAGQGAQAVRDAITQAIGTLPEQQTLGLNERRLTRAKVVYTGQHLVPDRSHNAVPDC